VSADLSIVIAVRDGAEWIEAAVRSASGADGLLEIVVVDDGSHDDGAELALGASDAVRVLRRPPRGLPAAHNVGVGAARGELLAFLDADDRWSASTPDPRRELLGGADAVLGRIQCVAAGEPHGEPFHNGGIAGLLVRREVLDRVGPFDEGLQHGHDLDWYLRARERGLNIPRSDAVVLHYTLRPDSLSDGPQGRAAQGLLAALARSRRRRGSAA